MATIVVDVQLYPIERIEGTIITYVGQWKSEDVGIWGQVPCLIDTNRGTPVVWQILGGIALCLELSKY